MRRVSQYKSKKSTVLPRTDLICRTFGARCEKLIVGYDVYIWYQCLPAALRWAAADIAYAAATSVSAFIL